MRAAAAGSSLRHQDLPRRLFRLFVLFVACSAMSCPEGTQFLEESGYITLNPASSLFWPGAVVAVEDDGREQIDTAKLKLVCGIRSSFGETWQPISSQTSIQTIKRSAKSSWHADASLLDRVNASGTSNKVQDIEISLKNARLLQIEDADVLANLRNRSPECRAAIAARLDLGYSVSLVSAALVADMDYRVTFKEEKKLTQRQRIAEMQKISASLGGGTSRLSSHTIESRGLAIGIKTDAFLMALSHPSNGDVHDELVDSHNRPDRHLPLREAEPVMQPDAPLVLPPGGYGIIDASAD